MALRCLSSIKANNKTINLMQFTSEAMATLWETSRNDYNWYNNTSSPPTPPDQYVTDYGTEITSEFYTQTWLSSGTEDYTIENSHESIIFKEYNTAVGARNIIGLRPYDYGGNDIFIRFQEAEVPYTTLHFGIIVDDENAQAVIILHTRRYGYSSAYDRLTIYTANTTRATFYYAFSGAEPVATYTSNGGGATHIAKVTGQLKDLSSNLSDILMVSGGGGGGYIVGENAYNGADAGGISGSGSNSANQSTGYAFGQGESGTNKSGGGGGLYGGYKGQ